MIDDPLVNLAGEANEGYHDQRAVWSVASFFCGNRQGIMVRLKRAAWRLDSLPVNSI
ncbi:MAG: hypothetical protein GZ093_04575 [Rhodoferax sp.]|nr:hypothetical protein [Rhodoferax sp.]